MKQMAALALAGATGLALAAPAHAAGFYLQEQGVRGTGRAYSGEVADQGVESLWWNPAAIASSGREAYVAANAVFVDGTVTNRGSTITYPGGVTLPVGGEAAGFNPIQKGVVPNFAIAVPVAERFAVGLSLAAPFDFTTIYRPNAWARYDALKSRLNTGDLQLTGAMKVTDWLDVGVAADAEYTDANLTNALPNPAPGLPDGMSQLRGHGWNWGWTAGAQAHFDRLTVGASYRSAITHDLNGRVVVSGLLGPLAGANANLPGRASFTTPWIATLGARWRLTDQLTLDAQAQRLGWSEFDAIRVTTAGPAQTIVQGYRDTTSGGVGFDYAANPSLTLRAGVQYDPTPTPAVGRTARVPDGDRWLFGVGATAQVRRGLMVDAALAYINFKDSTVNHDTTFYGGTPVATTTQLRGVVKGEGYVLALGLRKAF
ncbi:MAG: long-chain fatty acid transport protein [Phenylobacterium sp.]|nr:long-chain fatty acid transport protein [Phenylobacterium sp.]